MSSVLLGGRNILLDTCIRPSRVVRRQQQTVQPAGGQSTDASKTQSSVKRKKRLLSTNIRFEYVEGLCWQSPPGISLREIACEMVSICERLEKHLIENCVACDRMYSRRLEFMNVIDHDLDLILSMYHPVFCYVNCLERVPHKIRATNREEFDKEEYFLDNLKDAIKTSTGASAKIVCDRNLYRVARILQSVMASLLAIIFTYAAYFVDMSFITEDPARETATINTRAMQILNKAWTITDRCCPNGAVKALELLSSTDKSIDKMNSRQLSSFSPLTELPWITQSGFKKLAPISEHPLTDDLSDKPSFRKTVDEPPPLDLTFISTSQYLRFINQSSTLVDLFYKPAQYIYCQKNLFETEQKSDCYEILKRCCDRINKIRLPMLDNGWIARAMDHGSDNLRCETLLFLIKTFAHDLDGVPVQQKMDLPTQTMIWSTSPIVRKLVADALVILAYQLPYKDGAFKRFIPLLLSPHYSFRKMGVRLFTRCRTINLTALSLGIRILITHAIAPASSDDMLPWICAAADLAYTNAPFARSDCMKAIQEFWARSFSQQAVNSNIEQHYDKAFLIFAAFALTVLSIHPSQCLNEIPDAVLEKYDLLQKLIPHRLTLRFFCIPPTREPTAIRFTVNAQESSNSTADPLIRPRTESDTESEVAEEVKNDLSAASATSSSSELPTSEVIDVSDDEEEADNNSSDASVVSCPDTTSTPASSVAIAEQSISDFLADVSNPPPMDSTETAATTLVIWSRKNVSQRFLRAWRCLEELPAEFIKLPNAQKNLIDLPLAHDDQLISLPEEKINAMVVAMTPPEGISRPQPPPLILESALEGRLVGVAPNKWRYYFTGTRSTSCEIFIRRTAAREAYCLLITDAEGRILSEFKQSEGRIVVNVYETREHYLVFEEAVVAEAVDGVNG